ncbi:hypothetical protein ACFVOR_16320 [Streptomyces sp. NPDC057837]|uniref:hypothetical protein n=1 Tax=Streptomyces sp. NPDC057837 TaxID=3346260 RepID=UPI00367BC30C
MTLIKKRGHRYQYGAIAGAACLAAAGIGAIAHHLYPHGALFAVGALVLADAAQREHRRHQRLEAERAWARRRHTLYCPHPGPLSPCCLRHKHTKGQAHDARCTRPGEPGPPTDEAFLAEHRDHFERLVIDLPVPDGQSPKHTRKGCTR